MGIILKNYDDLEYALHLIYKKYDNDILLLGTAVKVISGLIDIYILIDNKGEYVLEYESGYIKYKEFNLEKIYNDIICIFDGK